MSHTPGPWSVPHFAVEDQPCNCVYVLSDGYAGSVCNISIDNGKRVGDGGNDAPPLEEAKANARLIAAAPNMLKTIQFIASIFEGEKIEGHEDCRCLVCEAIPTECARVLESIFGKAKKEPEATVAG